MDLAAVDEVLGMHGGYPLDFSNRTFSMFFEDLGVDIDHERYCEMGTSKANRLRCFLRTAEPWLGAKALEALLEHRGHQEGDEESRHLSRYQSLVTRLRGMSVGLPPPQSETVLSLTYARELEAKTSDRLAAGDLEGAITTARTTLEAVLRELEMELTGEAEHHGGDLQRAFKAVAAQLRIDDKRRDLDENFKQVVRGLVQVVNGLAPIRNKMSDGHARHRKPAPHHAHLIVNAAKTVATFLVESHAFQRERKMRDGSNDGKSSG